MKIILSISLISPQSYLLAQGADCTLKVSSAGEVIDVSTACDAAFIQAHMEASSQSQEAQSTSASRRLLPAVLKQLPQLTATEVRVSKKFSLLVGVEGTGLQTDATEGMEANLQALMWDNLEKLTESESVWMGRLGFGLCVLGTFLVGWAQSLGECTCMTFFGLFEKKEKDDNVAENDVEKENGADDKKNRVDDKQNSGDKTEEANTDDDSHAAVARLLSGWGLGTGASGIISIWLWLLCRWMSLSLSWTSIIMIGFGFLQLSCFHYLYMKAPELGFPQAQLGGHKCLQADGKVCLGAGEESDEELHEGDPDRKSRADLRSSVTRHSKMSKQSARSEHSRVRSSSKASIIEQKQARLRSYSAMSAVSKSSKTVAIAVAEEKMKKADDSNTVTTDDSDNPDSAPVTACWENIKLALKFSSPLFFQAWVGYFTGFIVFSGFLDRATLCPPEGATTMSVDSDGKPQKKIVFWFEYAVYIFQSSAWLGKTWGRSSSWVAQLSGVGPWLIVFFCFLNAGLWGAEVYAKTYHSGSTAGDRTSVIMYLVLTAHMFLVGVGNGSSYSNSMYQANTYTKLPKRFRELIVNLTLGIGNSGVIMACALSFLLNIEVMSKETLWPNKCPV